MTSLTLTSTSTFTLTSTSTSIFTLIPTFPFTVTLTLTSSYRDPRPHQADTNSYRDPRPHQVDTNSSVVARELVARGAHCVNDVSGGTHDPHMLPTIAALGVPAVLMHMRGTPDTMASLASYDDVVAEARASAAPPQPRRSSCAVLRRSSCTPAGAL